MEMFYVSHPYSGNEERNKQDARECVKNLQKRHSNVVFINPLDAFQALEELKMDKLVIMQMCVELMLKCDGVIFTGKWKGSEGCRLEYFMADEKKQLIFTDAGIFDTWYAQAHTGKKWNTQIWIKE